MIDQTRANLLDNAAVDSHPSARMETAPAETRSYRGLLTVPRSLWPLLTVLFVFAASAAVIPTGASVAISDDWTYTRSVEYLINEGEFRILSVAAATQVFQLFWGAGFAALLGMTFGALRLSTVALVFLSGIAFFGLCRELGLSRERSALGTAVYLFNPILFVISFTFMSDPHFLSLLVIASYGYVRGVRDWPEGPTARRWTLLGSLVAALACLQRPHGALIPLAVVTYLLASRRVRFAPFSRASMAPLARIVGFPVLAFIGYYALVSGGLPHQQGYFLDEARAAGFQETWLLVKRMTVIETVYIGLFVLPLAAAAIPAAGGLLRFEARRQWLFVFAWEAVLIGGVVWFAGENRWMPYIPHFLGRAGPGSGDLRGDRPPLVEQDVFEALTLVCLVASFVFALAIARSLVRRPSPDRSAAGLVTALLFWQVVGVIPASLLFRNWIISLDRYILPLLPFVILLGLWAMRDLQIVTVAGWAVAALFALFSIAGTRDALVYQEEIWTLARQLNAQGVANTQLDAGYAWDAYHLWEYGVANGIPERQFSGSWWTDVYAPATDGTFMIAGAPQPGYLVLSEHRYSAWLQREPVSLYVLQWEGAAPVQ